MIYGRRRRDGVDMTLLGGHECWPWGTNSFPLFWRCASVRAQHTNRPPLPLLSFSLSAAATLIFRVLRCVNVKPRCGAANPALIVFVCACSKNQRRSN